MNITGSINIEPNIGVNTPKEDEVNFSGASGAIVLNKSTWVQAVVSSVSAPSWYHDRSISFDASRSWSGSTSEEGNNTAHNNLQPYLSVFIWKRTA